MTRPLDGRTALVTGGAGGAGGIGSACATRLAADGAAVMLMGRSEASLAQTAGAIRAAHPLAVVGRVVGDAGAPDDMQRAVAAAVALGGGLDIVVATVGGSLFRPLLEHDVASFMGQLQSNLVPPFLAVRAAAPAMTAGGSIVCISSNVARINFLHLSAYVTAKAALEAFVRSAADELGSRVRVNAVRPGLVRVDRTRRLADDPDALRLYAEQTPLATEDKACALPGDIAEAVRYLAGPESSWVTGQSFAVDGGQELRRNPDLRGR
jgi:NAD(P)-dependent dehydrogenase (short-subunit alcohol dehydrogenase family)